YAQPRCKGDRPIKFMSFLADRRHGRVAPDHCHDSLVVIVKGSSSLTRNLSQDVFRSPITALLRNRTKLRDRQIDLIWVGNIREVTQYVNAGEAFNREIRLHFDATAMSPW